MSGIDYSGVPVTAGSTQPKVGSCSCRSSRDAKMPLDNADALDILREVVAVPIEISRSTPVYATCTAVRSCFFLFFEQAICSR